MTRVSIVVAAYNVAPYLSRCVDSLLSQTEQSIEVLIINDGSTDETPALAERYGSADPRVTVIHQQNGGVSAARNVGLRRATGTYVCFVDGDDWVEPAMTEAMASWCDSSGAEVAMAGAFIDFHNETDSLIRSELRSLPRYDIRRGRPLHVETIDDNFINLLGYPWNKIYRRDWLVSLDEWFEEGLSLFEDMDFNSRVLPEAELVALVPEAFVHYIQRPRHSLGAFRDTNFFALHSRTIDCVDSLLQEWGANEEVREDRKTRASVIALWSGLGAAARAPSPRQMLEQLISFPGAEDLLVMASNPHRRGWRGVWAISTINRGWYGVALFPFLTIRAFRNLAELRPKLDSRRLDSAALVQGNIQLLRTPTMFSKIKSMIPERYKGPVLAELKPGSYPDLEAWKGRKKVVITLAGFYQNLGDMALTYSQKRFIEAVLPDYEVLLFPSTHTYSRMKALKRVVGPEDIITTIAGGNMDDVYPSLENARRYVVRSFPDNPMISFPQTLAFSDTLSGKRALRRSARTYRAHDRLTVIGREPRTIELMKSGLSGVSIEYCPDIVLSLDPQLPARVRSGIMLTVRADKEVLLTSAERAGIREVIEAKTNDIVVKDTVDVALEDCQPDTFEKTLHDFWELLSTRKVVVTDRLHCMIFCVITKTPVVVLPNSNHKIKGTYEAWLKDHSYVRYLDFFDPRVLSEAIDEMWDLRPDQVTGPDLIPHYEPLRRVLLDAAGRSAQGELGEDRHL